MSRALDRVRGLAWLLDHSIPIPGTRFRIGLDPIIGMIPGLGDAAGAILSSYIVLEAARLGVSRSTVARMAFNVLVESVVGAVPLLGDLFDAGWKANQRNVALLERSVALPAQAHRRDGGFLLALGVAAAALVVGVATAGILLARWVWGMF